VPVCGAVFPQIVDNDVFAEAILSPQMLRWYTHSNSGVAERAPLKLPDKKPAQWDLTQKKRKDE
jgi:hypothetical protein